MRIWPLLTAVLLLALLLAADDRDAWNGEAELTPIFHGRVTDSDGDPVPGAEVRYLARARSDRGAVSAVPLPVDAVSTDAHGTYRIRRRDEATWLAADATGYGTSAIRLHHGGYRHDIVLLRPTSRVIGRLVTPAGRAIAGASIRASSRSERLTWWTSTTSDAAGTFALSLVPPATGLRIQAAGHWERWAPLRPPDAEGMRRQTFVLTAKPVISGRVIDADTGETIADAHVSFGSNPGPDMRTAADGRFTLSPEHRHQWAVNVSAAGYERAWGDPVPDDAGVLTVEVGMRRTTSPTSHRTPLPPSPTEPIATVRGTVVDEEGRPVAGALVRVAPLRIPNVRPYPRTRLTGTHGGFRMDVHRAGRLGLQAFRPGCAAYAQAWIRVRPGVPTAPVRLVVPTGHVLRGRVVEHGAGGLEGVFVTSSASRGGPRAEALTDAEGWFELRGLPERPVYVHWWHVLYGPRQVVQSVFGAMGEMASPISLSRRPLAHDPRPPAGHRVRFTGAEPPDGTEIKARWEGPGGTGGANFLVWDGEARISVLQDRKWTFEGPGFYAGPVAIPPLDDGAPAVFEIPTSPGVTIAGVVRTKDGAPRPGATVKLPHGTRSASDPRWNGVHTDAAGRFRFEGVKPGPPLQITAYATGFTRTKIVAARGATDVLVEIAPATPRRPAPRPSGDSTIEGLVRTRTGDPVPDAWVRASKPNDKTFGTRDAVTDDDGRFRIRALPEGTYDLVVAPAGHRRPDTRPRPRSPYGPSRVSGVRANTRDVEIVVVRRARIIGRVLPRPGPGRMEGCRITVRAPDIPASLAPLPPPPPGQPSEAAPSCTTGGGMGGWFVLDGLEPGVWHLHVLEQETLRAFLIGAGRTDKSIEVREGETVRGVEIQLQRFGAIVVDVREPDGSRATQAVVRAESEAWGSVEKNVPQHRISLVLGQCMPVRWTVRVRRGENTPWSEPEIVDVLPGARHDIEITLPAP